MSIIETIGTISYCKSLSLQKKLVLFLLKCTIFDIKLSKWKEKQGHLYSVL